MEKWTKAIRTIEPEMKRLHFFLLELNVTEGSEKIEIRGYPKDAKLWRQNTTWKQKKVSLEI